VIFHITTRDEADRARAAGEYEPAAFAHEGFIHCSYRHQVTGVANRLFRGRTGLVLFEIDPAKLACRVVDENLEGGTELYPHIYGRLPMSAVVAVHPFDVPQTLSGPRGRA
jgi:uncharacterized protein (DUF952 family)